MSAARDFTRWNRAGLSRVAYLDDNAATFVDLLRAEMAERFDWPAMEPDLAGATLATETPERRIERLLAQYAGREPHEIGEELIRAFARAAHVLAGHVDAYANEAWLRTATQWSTLRRLAATVGYQPQPPASASTLVALLVGADGASQQVAAGLAMQGAAPGAPPAVFETLDPVTVHPALNAIRAQGWDSDTRMLTAGELRWDLPKATHPGALLVVENEGGSGSVHSLQTAAWQDEGWALTVSPGWPQVPRHQARLHALPAAVKRGRPGSGGDRVVLQTRGAGADEDALVELFRKKGERAFVGRVVERLGRDQLLVEGATANLAGEELRLAALTPFTSSGSWTETDPGVEEVWWWEAGQARSARVGDAEISERGAGSSGRRKSHGTTVAHRFDTRSARVVWGRSPETKTQRVIVVGGGDPNVVEFDGRPDPRLVAGAWLIAVAGGERRALRVLEVTTLTGAYRIRFDRAPPAAPEETDFHGPMTLVARPLRWNRSTAAAVADGRFTSVPLPPSAAALIHPGRRLILGEEEDLSTASVVTVSNVTAEPVGEKVRLTLTFAEEAARFSGLAAGYSVLHANTVAAGHGEQKGVLVLGSGDAERERQSFRLAVRDISFSAHPGAEAGVAPAIRFTVNGEAWPYADRVEASAEGRDAWSYALEEDGSLTILPRRRLPTGTDNVIVTHHRRGQGPAGNGIPPGSFTRPKSKHASVEAIVQPFATAGGAPREAVSALRANAAARLAANGRAVAMDDYARLVRRHSSVWDARALQARVGGRAGVEVVVWPAGGTSSLSMQGGASRLTQSLADELSRFIRARARPGIPFAVRAAAFSKATLRATVRIDAARHDPRAIEASVRKALFAAFGMAARGIGQDFHIGEAIGVVERVPGVQTSTLVIGAQPSARIERYSDGTARTIRAGADEVIALESEADAFAQAVAADG